MRVKLFILSLILMLGISSIDVYAGRPRNKDIVITLPIKEGAGTLSVTDGDDTSTESSTYKCYITFVNIAINARVEIYKDGALVKEDYIKGIFFGKTKNYTLPEYSDSEYTLVVKYPFGFSYSMKL